MLLPRISPRVGSWTLYRAGSGEGVCILGQRRSLESVKSTLGAKKQWCVTHFALLVEQVSVVGKSKQLRVREGGPFTSERDAKVWVRKCVRSDELLFKDSRLDINAVAIMGAVRFLDGWYLWVLSRFAPCGELAGHTVHEVVETKLIALSTCSVSPSPMSSDEKRYYAIFMSHARSLRSNSFFSFSYDLTNSVQYNNDVCAGNSSGEYNDQMTWNAHHLRGILAGVPIEPSTAARGILTRWLLPVIHGFFEQCTFLIPDGRSLHVSLVARRSRHYAGTRFLCRGVQPSGHVANEVETEQIIHVSRSASLIDCISSAIQMRGSIPVAWRHRNIRAARKPSIVVEEGGDHDASMRHFDGVAKRYETPIVVLNLVRQQEKRAYETKLSAQYLRAIGAINTQRRGSNPVPSDRASEFPLQCPSGSPEAPYIAYVSFDLLRYAKTSGSRALGALQQITDGVAAHTGVFCSSSERQRDCAPTALTAWIEQTLRNLHMEEVL